MKKDTAQKISILNKRYTEGDISRREFLRALTVLGLSFGTGEFLAACRQTTSTNLSTPTLNPTQQELMKDPLEEIYGLNYITTTPDLDVKTPVPVSENTDTQAVDSSQGSAEEIILWYCSSCGKRFYSLEALKNHAAEEHAWRLPHIEKVDQPTYKQFLNDDINRFDEKNTVFSRNLWDAEHQKRVGEAAAKAPVDDWDVIERKAITAGAIYVDQTAGSLHPNYYGYAGYIRDAGGLFAWEDPVSPDKYPVPDPAWMSDRVKQIARFYGANLVGITEINPLWVYSHYYERATMQYEELEIPYKYAIVMGIEMNSDFINESPGPEASATTALAYSQMAEISGSLAKYIRALGYPAVPSGNDTTQSIPMAIDAGLGELGRLGLLLTPEYGPRQRLCKVYTDLPLIPDKPIDFGIQSFCETCHACANACPVNAIQWEDRTTDRTSISNRPGILRWPVDVAKCFLFWTENGNDCSNCVAACPWALHIQRDWLERT